jgi:DNA gyrase subunit A
MKVNAKTGRVVTIKSVVPEEELMLITRNGVVNRQGVEQIRIIGRATQGVRLVSLDNEDAIVDVARIIPDDDEEEMDGVSGGDEGVETDEEVAITAEEGGEGEDA